MTLLSVTRDTCTDIGVSVPSSVFTNITNNRTAQELLALANEMAQRITYDSGRDWQKLKKLHTMTGDGVATSFDLPADFKRMLLTSNLWISSQTQTPMRFVPDTDEWIQRRMAGVSEAWGEWTMLGGQIHIHPTLAAGSTVQYAYMHKNCIALASGGFGDVFLSDNDTFAIDERLLKLGMIWQWKAKKGTPYAEELGTFSDALAIAMGHDKPSPIIIGRHSISANARVAYPWPVPT